MNYTFMEGFARDLAQLVADSRELKHAKEKIAALEALLPPSPIVVAAESRPLQVTGIDTVGEDG